jgi:hypothetical protein
MAVTRLAQNTGLALKMYYDCNPPPQNHWTYQLFVNKVDPESRHGLPHPDNFAAMQINPIHNAGNLPKEYMQELKAFRNEIASGFCLVSSSLLMKTRCGMR